MALVQVQKKKQGSGDNTNHSITLDSTPTQGNVIIFFVVGDMNITVPPSGYTLAIDAVSFIHGYVYYKIAGAAESPTVSITINTTANVSMQAFEYSGLTASPLDKTGSQTATGSGTSIFSGNTGTTSQARELILVSANMRTDEVPAQTVTAWDNSFTIENEMKQGGIVGVLLNVASREVNSIGDYSSTGTITTGGLGFDVGLIASFKIQPDPSIATVSWFTA